MSHPELRNVESGHDASWTAPKLIALGAVSLAIALAIIIACANASGH